LTKVCEKQDSKFYIAKSVRGRETCLQAAPLGQLFSIGLLSEGALSLFHRFAACERAAGGVKGLPGGMGEFLPPGTIAVERATLAVGLTEVISGVPAFAVGLPK
jgi:hypothetical protein